LGNLPEHGKNALHAMEGSIKQKLDYDGEKRT